MRPGLCVTFLHLLLFFLDSNLNALTLETRGEKVIIMDGSKNVGI